MYAAMPILSATNVMLIVVGVISLAILVNEAGLFWQTRKGGEKKRSKRSKKAKATKSKKVKQTSATFDELEDPYAAFGPVNSAGVESFTPVGLDQKEEDEIRESGSFKHVSRVESMRVGRIDRESVRSGKARSDIWNPDGPVEGIGAVDYQHSSLASQLRAAQQSGNYDEYDEESMRIQLNQDGSVRIMDTRIDSAAFRRSA